MALGRAITRLAFRYYSRAASSSANFAICRRIRSDDCREDAAAFLSGQQHRWFRRHLATTIRHCALTRLNARVIRAGCEIRYTAQSIYRQQSACLALTNTTAGARRCAERLSFSTAVNTFAVYEMRRDFAQRYQIPPSPIRSRAVRPPVEAFY